MADKTDHYIKFLHDLLGSAIIVCGIVMRCDNHNKVYLKTGVGTAIRTYLSNATVSEFYVIVQNDRDAHLPAGNEFIQLLTSSRGAEYALDQSEKDQPVSW